MILQECVGTRAVPRALCLSCLAELMEVSLRNYPQAMSVVDEMRELASNSVDVLQDSASSVAAESETESELESVGSLEDFVADDNASIAESEWTADEDEDEDAEDANGGHEVHLVPDSSDEEDEDEDEMQPPRVRRRIAYALDDDEL